MVFRLNVLDVVGLNFLGYQVWMTFVRQCESQSSCPDFQFVPYLNINIEVRKNTFRGNARSVIHLTSDRWISTQFIFNNMEHNDILARIEEKINRLGEAKKDLENQTIRLKDECDALYRINKELQAQIEELSEKNSELQNTGALHNHSGEDLKMVTRQRINELVKEVDECIALLNK